MSPTDLDIQRLKTRREFLFVRPGENERRRTVVVEARPRGDGAAHVRIGVTATKKIGGAVQRNRAKRRLRHAARALLARHGVAGVDYVFIARKATGETAWGRLLDDMESALISLARRLDAPDPRGGASPSKTERRPSDASGRPA